MLRSAPPARHTQRRIAAGFILLVTAGLLLASTDADALPRYAARYGQSCQTCHVDPGGGGLRNLYASTLLLPMDLVYKPRAMDKLSTFDPRISDQLLVGLDLRTLFLDGEGESGRIVQMQSDVYVSLTLDENTRAVVEIGRNGNRQAYGLARVLPANGTVRAGRFAPEYGWVFADHQRVTRKYLLERNGSNDPAIWEAAGFELGLHPDRADLSFSLNEGGQIGDSYTARAVGRVEVGPLHVTAGASALRRWRSDGHRRALGAFGAVGIRELTALVQYDEIRENAGRETLLASELDWLVHQGWTVIAGMDYRDPDRRRRSGAERQWFFGLDLLATPHFGATVLGRFNDVDRGPDVTRDRLSLNAVLHFFY